MNFVCFFMQLDKKAKDLIIWICSKNMLRKGNFNEKKDVKESDGVCFER